MNRNSKAQALLQRYNLVSTEINPKGSDWEGVYAYADSEDSVFISTVDFTDADHLREASDVLDLLISLDKRHAKSLVECLCSIGGHNDLIILSDIKYDPCGRDAIGTYTSVVDLGKESATSILTLFDAPPWRHSRIFTPAEVMKSIAFNYVTPGSHDIIWDGDTPYHTVEIGNRWYGFVLFNDATTHIIDGSLGSGFFSRKELRKEIIRISSQE